AAADQIRRVHSGAAMVDFGKSGPRLMKHLASKWSGQNRIDMGYPSFDRNSGGLMPGDFISVIGSTGSGKTQLLLSRAMYFWETLKLPVVFISGEMNTDAILERAAALYSHVPADYLKHGILPNIGPVDYKQKLNNAMEKAAEAGATFHIVDANLAMSE